MPSRTSSPGAVAQRGYRRRKKTGDVLATAEVPLRVVERLIEMGWLKDEDASDKKAIGAALVVVTGWALIVRGEFSRDGITLLGSRVGYRVHRKEGPR